jgi:hypothetical protein
MRLSSAAVVYLFTAAAALSSAEIFGAPWKGTDFLRVMKSVRIIPACLIKNGADLQTAIGSCPHCLLQAGDWSSIFLHLLINMSELCILPKLSVSRSRSKLERKKTDK